MRCRARMTSGRLSSALSSVPATKPSCTPRVSHAAVAASSCHSRAICGATAETPNQSPMPSSTAIERRASAPHRATATWYRLPKSAASASGYYEHMQGYRTVMAIGGNEDKRGEAAILGQFVDRSGAREARIAIIPAASAEPEIRAAEYTRIFSRFGAAHVHTVHAQRGVTRDELMLITNASGIFVTGGDQ